MKLSNWCLTIAAGALLTGCGMMGSDPKPAQPPTGSLARTLDLMDKEGIRYGTLELDPLGGGGKVYDASGKLIGKIVPPDAGK